MQQKNVIENVLQQQLEKLRSGEAAVWSPPVSQLGSWVASSPRIPQPHSKQTNDTSNVACLARVFSGLATHLHSSNPTDE